MKKRWPFRKLLFLLVLASPGWAPIQAQRLQTPSPSPTQTLKQEFGLSGIELSYSRPGVKGRAIFGDLVPYGKVWRTGANGATTLNFGEEMTIGNTKIPAGRYGLLTIPEAGEWTFIITRQTDVTNPASYKQDQDIVRVKVSPVSIPFSVETLTIFFSDISSSSCNLVLLWDKTMVTLPLRAEIDGKVMAQIDDIMTRDNKPYFAAAMYYLDNGKDLNKALEWFNKADQQSPDSYPLTYQKARCLAKLGRKQEAVTTAKKGIELAKQANNADYVALNEKLIASLK